MNCLLREYNRASQNFVDRCSTPETESNTAAISAHMALRAWDGDHLDHPLLLNHLNYFVAQ